MSQDEFFCLMSAFRYASGRQTYAMTITISYIDSRIKDMTEVQLKQVLHEIEMRRADAISGYSKWDEVGREEQKCGWLEHQVKDRMNEMGARD